MAARVHPGAAPPPPLPVRKIVIVGGSNVGKSALIRRYLLDQGLGDAPPAAPRNDIAIGTKPRTAAGDWLEVWDVPPSASADAADVSDAFLFADADAVALVFDLPNAAPSLRAAAAWLARAQACRRNVDVNDGDAGPVPCVLVGAKDDALAALSEAQRGGVLWNANEWARQRRVPFLACSAATGDGVGAVFESLGDAASAVDRAKAKAKADAAAAAAAAAAEAAAAAAAAETPADVGIAIDQDAGPTGDAGPAGDAGNDDDDHDDAALAAALALAVLSVLSFLA